MQAVCVFCGSNPGIDPRFLEGARALGAVLASSGRTLVYGGAKVGLMGAVADAALAGGGKVIGVLPQALVEREVAHSGLTELHVVSGMHERKKMMAGLADAFITMPGGLGTLEELFEMWTWAQLGLHRKPIGLLGPKAFFAPLLHYLDQLVAEGFVRPDHRERIALEEQPEPLLDWLERHEVAAAPKWLDGAIT
jgi:uncharacterized protein (TIGR00730 family)